MAAFANFKLITTDTSIDTFLKVRPMGNVRKLFGLITDTGNATKGVTTCIAPFASNFIVEHVLVRVCILVHAYLRALIVDRAAAYRCMRSSSACTKLHGSIFEFANAENPRSQRVSNRSSLIVNLCRIGNL